MIIRDYMNNKGFAITTVIYGLSILGILLIIIIMGNLSNTRSNIKTLSKDIDNELNYYSRASISYSYTGENDLQQFEVPVGQSGWYRFELWGASGNGVNGGKGAYTTGIIKLTEGDLLYIKVGKSSTGKAGESTDVRIVADNEDLGLLSRIMVAAGGGIEPGSDGGTLCGYNQNMNSSGGMIKDDYHLDTSRSFNYIGTLYPSTSPETVDDCVVGSTNGRTKTKDTDASLSGDGYYISNSTDANNYGGSSYISGYAGVLPITNVKKPSTGGPSENYRSTYINQYDVGPDGEITGDGNNYGQYVFKDGLMIPGVRSGDGLARIEKLSISNDDSVLKNKEYFYNIKSIKDCSSTGLKDLEVIKDGIAANFSVTSTTTDGSGRTCVTYTNSSSSGSDEYYDEIALWHNSWDNIGSTAVTISYSPKGQPTLTRTTTLNLTDAGTETIDGYRISAYQPDYYHEALDPDGGNYYIFSVLSDNKVLSAQQRNDSDMNPVELAPLIGEARQKWTVAAISDNLKESPSVNDEYSIVELTRYGALSVEYDSNIDRNRIYAYNKFNKLTRNASQIWKIIPVGNGTFRINTATNSISPDSVSLLATPSTENGIDNFSDQLMITDKNVETARFKFYKLDY